MICPSCNYTLQRLSVTTNNGGKFEVDHCGRCGGTWFDPYEINRIPYHEVSRLAQLTVLPKRTDNLSTYTQLCPHCHTKLLHFTAESVPAGVKLLRCPKDRGIWATQRDLAEFKKQQDERIEEYKKSSIAFPALSVVFVPAIFTLLLVVSTFITVTRLQEERESRIKAADTIERIQIVSISPTTVSVTFQTKASLKSKISYGKSTLELIDKTITTIPTLNHDVLLTDLKPNTFYIYKITLEDETGNKFTTEEQVFVTGGER